MTTTAGNIAEFTTVDRASQSSFFVRFMDTANQLPDYRVIRRGLAESLGDLDGRTVLDAGSGTGDDARELAGLVGAHGRVVGTDLSQTMVDEAKRRSSKSTLPVEFHTADLAKLPFADATFDGVRAKLVLMHTADIDSVATELIRVTKPGGRLAIFDYDFETTTVDHPDIATTREIVRCASDGHPNNWCGRQLRRRFIDLGVRDAKVVPYTVVMPLEFFRVAVGGRLEQAIVDGQLALTTEQLAAWWQPLIEADAQGKFFASLTGFLLSATR